MNLDEIHVLRDLVEGEDAVVFVTGQVGSGKTTVVEKLENFGYGVMYLGREIRSFPDLMRLLNEDNSGELAPTATEAFVRTSVEEKLKTDINTLVVDGMPRSVSQVEFCLKVCRSYDRQPVFVLVSAPQEKRRARFALRNREDDVGNRFRMDQNDVLMKPVVHAIIEAAEKSRWVRFFNVNNDEEVVTSHGDNLRRGSAE